MSILSKTWETFATIVQLTSQVKSLGDVSKEQGVMLRQLTERLIRLETLAEISLSERRGKLPRPLR